MDLSPGHILARRQQPTPHEKRPLPFADGSVRFRHDMSKIDVGIPLQVPHQQPDFGFYVAFPVEKAGTCELSESTFTAYPVGPIMAPTGCEASTILILI